MDPGTAQVWSLNFGLNFVACIFFIYFTRYSEGLNEAP